MTDLIFDNLNSAMTDELSNTNDLQPSRERRLLLVMERIERIKTKLRGENHSMEKLIELAAVGLVAGEELAADLEQLRSQMGRSEGTVAILDALAGSTEGGYDMKSVVDLVLSELRPTHESLLALKTIIHSAEQSSISRAGKHAAVSRHIKGPEAEAKEYVRQRWMEWRKQPTRYKNASRFAADMVEKLPDDGKRDQITITRWVRAWDKAEKLALCAHS